CLGWSRGSFLDDLAEPSSKLPHAGTDHSLLPGIIQAVGRELVMTWIFEVANPATGSDIQRLDHADEITGQAEPRQGMPEVPQVVRQKHSVAKEADLSWQARPFKQPEPEASHSVKVLFKLLRI